jgi:hypothetical protein
MRRLHTKVNLIPVIAKADTLTDDLVLGLEVGVVALLDVLDNWAPGVIIVDKVTEAGGMNTLFNTSLYPPKERTGPNADIIPKTVSIQSTSDLVLGLEVGVVALLDVLDNWAPGVIIVDKVTEARSIPRRSAPVLMPISSPRLCLSSRPVPTLRRTVAAVDLVLGLEVGVVALLDVLDNWAPGVIIVDKVQHLALSPEGAHRS